jgi:hypothetical protein
MSRLGIRLALAALAASLLLVAPASSSASGTVVRDYVGKTSQGQYAHVWILTGGRVSFHIFARYRCSNGATMRDAVDAEGGFPSLRRDDSFDSGVFRGLRVWPWRGSTFLGVSGFDLFRPRARVTGRLSAEGARGRVRVKGRLTQAGHVCAARFRWSAERSRVFGHPNS